MIGVECAWVPSLTVHLMFLPLAGSKESGKPCSVETMLRDQAAPHCGWSEAREGKHQDPSTNIQRNPKAEIRNPKEARKSNSLRNGKNRNLSGGIRVIVGADVRRLKL